MTVSRKSGKFKIIENGEKNIERVDSSLPTWMKSVSEQVTLFR